MIIGAHAIVYSRDAEADRGFLRDALGLPHVDAGHGWLIFGLPPAELAVHPAEGSGRQELYLLCDDVRALVRSLRRRKVACSPLRRQPWGTVTQVSLPGGGLLGIYQPSHPRPAAPDASGAGSRRPRRPGPAKVAKAVARRAPGH